MMAPDREEHEWEAFVQYLDECNLNAKDARRRWDTQPELLEAAQQALRVFSSNLHIHPGRGGAVARLRHAIRDVLGMEEQKPGWPGAPGGSQ